jgi:hypothetical protein
MVVISSGQIMVAYLNQALPVSTLQAAETVCQFGSNPNGVVAPGLSVPSATPTDVLNARSITAQESIPRIDGIERMKPIATTGLLMRNTVFELSVPRSQTLQVR